MSMMKYHLFLSVFAFNPSVIAHGQVTGIIAEGEFYKGYQPSSQSQHLKIAGWSAPQDSKNGPIYPSSYTTPDIICNIGGTPSAISIPVTAGSSITLQWTPWPETHHGPVLNYLANCNGPCTSTSKESLVFKKIDALGLLRQSPAAGQAGYWAADKLREGNNSWTVTIPTTVAPGNYVLRHEIIALHSARAINGAQNYPHCVNLEIKGVGTDELARGTLGMELYKETDPGVLIDIYRPLTYAMPGPALYSHGSGSVASLPYRNSSVAATVVGQPSKPALGDGQEDSTPLNPIAGNQDLALMSSSLPPSSSITPNAVQTTNTNPNNSPPHIAEAHESANALISSTPSQPISPASPQPTTPVSPLPDLRFTSQPAAPYTTPSLSSRKHKPCTRRVRITTSPSSTSTPFAATPTSTPSYSFSTPQPLNNKINPSPPPNPRLSYPRRPRKMLLINLV